MNSDARRSVAVPGHSATIRGRAGFSLVELLVASAIALVVMGALATLLGLFSRTASTTQAIIDLTSRMRQTASLLQSDLRGVVVEAPSGYSVGSSDGLPPYSVAGYFELIEGPESDAGKPWRSDIAYPPGTRVTYGRESWTVVSGTSLNAQPDISPTAWQRTTSITADIDDALLFTTRRQGDPFTGRQGNTGQFAQSQAAEVAWFCQLASAQTVPGVTLYNIYRRQLLILPYVGASPFFSGEMLDAAGVWSANSYPNSISIQDPWPATTWVNLFTSLSSLNRCFDISLRRIREDANNNSALDFGEALNPGTFLESFLLPNSLTDLARRENRFWRQSYTAPFTPVFPYRFPQPLTSSTTPAFDGTVREGEDLLLTNVVSFDVRVFDPDAPVHSRDGQTLIPGDPGYPVAPIAVVPSSTNLPATAAVNDMYQARDTGEFWVCRGGATWEKLARGAYVDLGWGVPAPAGFSGPQLAVPARIPFDINPAATSPGYDNVFPGSEDSDKNGSLAGTEDVNGNGRLDFFTPFQGFGMAVRNVAASNPLSQLYLVGNWQNASTTRWPPPSLAYDTWPISYEANGDDDDGDGTVDEGSNGQENNGNAMPDDPAEFETSAPYPVPLRGVEIRIRCLEPVSKQIRQITIRHSFMNR